MKNVKNLMEKVIEKKFKKMIGNNGDWDELENIEKEINEKCSKIWKECNGIDCKCFVLELYNNEERFGIGGEGLNMLKRYCDEEVERIDNEIYEINRKIVEERERNGKKYFNELDCEEEKDRIYFREEVIGLNVNCEYNDEYFNKVFVCICYYK